MLSLKQLQNVCLSNSSNSKQCRYLESDDNDYNKFYCRKLRKDDKNKIDKKIDEVVAELKSKKIDPKKQSLPMGDNCTGYPYLKHVAQGYDKP